jgi:hypothetical protein
MIINGMDSEDGSYYFVFASCNSLVTESYQLDNAFTAVDSGDDSSKKPKDSAESVNKPYSGYYGPTGLEAADSSNQWLADTSLNAQNDVKSSTISENRRTLDGTGTTAMAAGTYQSYYTRLKAAVKEKGKGYTTGLTWYSWNSLCWALGTAYNSDGSETAYTMASYIELLRARNVGANEKSGYDEYIDESYGGGYYAAHGWRDSTAAYEIGARLEVSSSYYNTYFKKGKTYWAGPDFSKCTKDTDYIKAKNGAKYAINDNGAGAEAAIVVNTKKERGSYVPYSLLHDCENPLCLKLPGFFLKNYFCHASAFRSIRDGQDTILNKRI